MQAFNLCATVVSYFVEELIACVELVTRNKLVGLVRLGDRSWTADNGWNTEASREIARLGAISHFRLSIAADPGFHARDQFMGRVDLEIGVGVDIFEMTPSL